MTVRRGVGLVEVVVALVVWSVAWLGLWALQFLALRTVLDAGLREEARWTLQAVADGVEAGDLAVPGRRVEPWGWVEWRGADGGVRLEAWSRRDSVVAVLWTAAEPGR